MKYILTVNFASSDFCLNSLVVYSMPMLDLLVLISAKNKMNPASYTIARIAHDLNGETVQVITV